MDESDGNTKIPEIAEQAPKCPDPNCPTCYMVARAIEAFEAAVVVLAAEMDKDQKSIGKIDLIAGVALDLGSAFSRLMDRTDVSRFAVPDAKIRFVRAAKLMNEKRDDIRQLQMLAGIIKVGKGN